MPKPKPKQTRVIFDAHPRVAVVELERLRAVEAAAKAWSAHAQPVARVCKALPEKTGYVYVVESDPVFILDCILRGEPPSDRPIVLPPDWEIEYV